MNIEIEKSIFKNGYKLIGSIDEAGRGPLAGPVVAACVICGNDFNPEGKWLEKIKDSKKLTEKKREELFDVIYSLFEEVGVGACDHETIDRINILQASFLAMKKAIGELRKKPDFILLDGKLFIPNISIKQRAIVKGDSSVFSIAAASIIAKVTRDRMMDEYHQKYPQYGFDKHRGYGTKMHLESLINIGYCPIHRKSFSPVKNTFAGF